MINKMPEEVIKQLINEFNVDTNNPDLVKLLKDIIKIDNNSNLGDLFYQYFFVHDKKIEDLVDKLYKSFNDDCLFKIMHGYSKNGKTTFINYLIYSYHKKIQKVGNYELLLIPFDFEKIATGGNFIEKVKKFYTTFFFEEKKEKRIVLNIEIEKYCQFIEVFLDKLKDKDQSALHDYIEDTFYEIKQLFKNYVYETHNGESTDLDILKSKFDEFIKNKINEKNCGNYFAFLFFFRFFKQRNLLLSEKKYRVVFTLDNIDDYLEDEDITFLQQPQIHLSTLFYQLSYHPHISKLFIESLAECSNCKPSYFDFHKQITIIYIFRTANFLIFANLITEKIKLVSDTNANNFRHLLEEEEYFRFKTVSKTSDILSLRLERFKEIANYIIKKATTKIEIPSGYSFLKALANNFDTLEEEHPSDINIRRIYNIWNGDKFALWTAITGQWNLIQKQYFKNEKYLQFLSNLKSSSNNSFRYLLRGVYVNFFLFLLHKNETLDGVFKQAIYSFNECYSGTNKKNISRLILTYIINKTLQSGKPTRIKDIHSKGVGLYDVLFEIDNYIQQVNNASGKIIYTFSEVENFFKELCGTKIEYFGQLFSIYKDQTSIKSKGVKCARKYYDLVRDINKFKREKENPKIKQKLNKIRLFNNDNAAYISASLLTNYELHSYISINENKAKTNKFPLPLLFELCKDEGIITATKHEDFKFCETIDRVYNHTEKLVNAMIDFYCEPLISINIYSPDNFLNSDLFFVKKERGTGKADFQFRMIISRHITYLELFRQTALKHSEKIIKLNDKEKAIINKYLVEVIVKYCTLYENSYNRIKEAGEINAYNPLEDSHKNFRDFKRIGDKIINDNDVYNFEKFQKLQTRGYANLM